MSGLRGPNNSSSGKAPSASTAVKANYCTPEIDTSEVTLDVTLVHTIDTFSS